MNITSLHNDKDPVTIEITQKAKDKIDYIVDTVDSEVGWLGTVDRFVDESTGCERFVITDVFVPYQQVTGATCEIKPKGRHELAAKLLKMYPEDNAGMEMVNKLMFWGHSHVDMGVTPSGQDEAQTESYSTREYLIRGIFNKRGEYKLDLFYFAKGLKYSDIKFSRQSSLTAEEIAELDADIKTNVEAKRDTAKSPWRYGYNDALFELGGGSSNTKPKGGRPPYYDGYGLLDGDYASKDAMSSSLAAAAPVDMPSTTADLDDDTEYRYDIATGKVVKRPRRKRANS